MRGYIVYIISFAGMLSRYGFEFDKLNSGWGNIGWYSNILSTTDYYILGEPFYIVYGGYIENNVWSSAGSLGRYTLDNSATVAWMNLMSVDNGIYPSVALFRTTNFSLR